MVINRVFRPVRFILLLHLVFLAQFGWSQADSTINAQQDSLLSVQQENTLQLLNIADSIRLADSLEQAALQQQILELQASDQRRKEALQTRLDSLQQAQEQKALRVRQQVDSLRASTPGIPVVLFKDTVFYIYSRLGPFSPSDRAASVSNKVEMLVNSNQYQSEQLKVLAGEESFDVVHDNLILFSITERDAFWADQTEEEVATQHLEAVKQSIAAYQIRTGPIRTLTRVGLLFLEIILFFLLIKYMNKGFTWMNVQLVKRSKRLMKGITFKNYEFLTVEQELQVLRWILKMIKWFVIILVVYLAMPVAFSIFPATKGIATTLLDYILSPLKRFGSAVINYIPELFTIGVIIVVTHYFVRFLRFVFWEIQSEKLKVPGFYADWAIPTFNLLKIIVYAFAFVIIFPYLPGSDSPIFQGVSVFFGLLISLGSSSAISNIIAGLVITYMRPFKIGDRVKIGDTVGDVIEKTMLVTRLRTIKNEDVTIPNSAILNGNTINYTSNSKGVGLILSTTVTIGYDVPWRKVHELLISAAQKTEHIKNDPQPFVLQTSLDDFYVSYQLNAYTDQAGVAAKIYSQLHSHIQDAFNEGDVEILSPHYRAVRDGNMITIPADYLPKDYQVPSFQVKVNKEK